MAFWGPIIGAVGSSLLGGLFGGRSKEKPKVETVQNTVDYAGMVAGAEAAGFNPLTALRNGGTAGWTKSVGTTTGGTSKPTVGASIANAVASGFAAFGNYDPMKAKRDVAEYDLIQAQIGNINQRTAEGARRMTSFEAPTRRASETVTGMSPASRPLGGTLKTGAPQASELGKKEVSNPWQNSVIDPTTANASAFEERYGGSEIAETEAYIRTRLADTRANLRNAITGSPTSPIAPWAIGQLRGMADRASRGRQNAVRIGSPGGYINRARSVPGISLAPDPALRMGRGGGKW